MKTHPSIYVPLFKRSVTLKNPVKNERFLWHITYNQKETNLLIARQGITLPLWGAVYAHHALPSFDFMYPYFVDRVDWFYHNLRDDGAQFDDYAFWRIDTRFCGFTWYLDPGMERDSQILQVPHHHYLCTPNAIPPHALRLYRFNLDNYRFRNPRIIYKNGCALIRPIRSDFDTLEPADEFNQHVLRVA